jgi:hypothetical protein
MSTVTAGQMKSTLLSVDQVFNQLAKTEPLSTTLVSKESKISFVLDPSWHTDLEAVGDTEVVGAVMRINGVESQMTKEAALQAGSNFGLSAAYMKKVPAHYIEGLLNYHYSGGIADESYNALSVGDNIAAFTRPNMQPFSNIHLLESTIEGIKKTYGSNTEVLVDYKFQNSLRATDIRLIIPEAERIITGGGMGDVPTGESDRWSAGIHLSNSLIGKRQTEVDAYLFRWWCTNGATTTLDTLGSWNRRTDGQDEISVYDWARDSVDEILGGLEFRFDQVQALTALSVAGNTGDVLREIFETYKVPVSQREQISTTMLESENLTMYSVMNAITQEANAEGVKGSNADRLMRIGGALPTTTFDTLKAKVWNQGHAADSTSKNPYEISLIGA